MWMFIQAMVNSKFMTKKAGERQGGRNELKDLLRKKVNHFSVFPHQLVCVSFPS